MLLLVYRYTLSIIGRHVSVCMADLEGRSLSVRLGGEDTAHGCCEGLQVWPCCASVATCTHC